MKRFLVGNGHPHRLVFGIPALVTVWEQPRGLRRQRPGRMERSEWIWRRHFWVQVETPKWNLEIQIWESGVLRSEQGRPGDHHSGRKRVLNPEAHVGNRQRGAGVGRRNQREGC